MIKVILADDEPIIIKGLRKLIDWNRFGMDIVGHAYDGEELMTLIGQLHPDIVISDISMPHRTGIDMIKEIHRLGLPVKVIFISAYQEFAYARDAVAYGAVDYLVKPVVKQQLESVLDKTISLITEQHEEEKRKGKLQLLESKHRHDELQERLIQLTDGNLSPQSEAFRETQVKLKGPLHSVAIVEVDRLGGDSDRWTEKEKKLVEFAIGNILQEVVVDSSYGYSFMKDARHVIVVCHTREGELADLAEDIKAKIASFLKLQVSVSVSRPVQEAVKLASAYREAEQAMEMKYFFGLNRVILFSPPELPLSFDKELYARQQDVIRAITTNEWDKTESALSKWLSTIKASTFGNRSLSVTTCLSSVLYIIQELSKLGIQLREGISGIRELQDRLGAYDTYDAMGEQIMQQFQRICLEIGSDAGSKDRILLAKVKQYIEKHYSEDISLETIAALVFMNPYYFSSFFKKHKKQNFKQYVTEVRMKHALHMLGHTDLMVYEIAEKVGYNNARHFSDMFKKMYGKLPNDYRQDAKK
ncbi:response regulator [Paenibacillus tarimensis]